MEGSHMEGTYIEGSRMEGSHKEGSNLEGSLMEGSHMEGSPVNDEQKKETISNIFNFKQCIAIAKLTDSWVNTIFCSIQFASGWLGLTPTLLFAAAQLLHSLGEIFSNIYW